MYRVTRAWLADVPDEETAKDVADNSEPDLEYVHLAELPDGRYTGGLDVQKYYEQPIEVLDRAWDDYMDRSLPAELTGSTRPQLPDLGVLSPGITTQQLSMVFDCAISAYRHAYESVPPSRG